MKVKFSLRKDSTLLAFIQNLSYVLIVSNQGDYQTKLNLHLYLSELYPRSLSI